MPKKKILHIIEYFNVAGAEHIVKDLCMSFNNSDYESEVLVLNERGILGKELKSKGFIVHELNWKKNEIPSRKMKKAVSSLISIRKVDIIHAHNWSPWYYAVFSKHSHNVKLIVTIHGHVEKHQFLKKQILFLFLSIFTDKIIFVSNNIIKQFVLYKLIFNNIIGNKYLTIPNGVKLGTISENVSKDEIRSRIGVGKDDFLLLTVGRYYAVKNLEMQIKLVQLLEKQIPNLKLAIAARIIPYAERIKALAKDLDVGNKIHFLGLRHDIPELLHASDVFVLSSFTEGTSLSLLEAMSIGKAIVVSNVNGNRQIIQHNSNGLLFNVKDVCDFKDQVIQLWTNDDLRKKLEEQALITAKNYSIENMLKKYELIYHTHT